MTVLPTRKALLFLRAPVAKDGGGSWDESAHTRGEGGRFGAGLAHATTDKGRSVVSGDALRKALPPGTKVYEGIPLKSVREVHLPSDAEHAETGLRALVYRNATVNPRTGEAGQAPKRPVYVYSDAHHQQAADAKFAKAAKLASGGHAAIQTAYRKDLGAGDDKVRAVAAVVALMDATTMRVGGQGKEGGEETGVGATTMEAQHVTRTRDGLRFQFTGKSGKDWDRTIKDPAVVKAVSGFLAGKKPGDPVFPVDRHDVNEYLHDKVPGAHVTAKDFRTYHATALADAKFRAEPTPKTPAEAKAAVARVVKATSEHLGNTPAVCRDKYIDPRAIDRYMARLPGKSKGSGG